MGIFDRIDDVLGVAEQMFDDVFEAADQSFEDICNVAGQVFDQVAGCEDKFDERKWQRQADTDLRRVMANVKRQVAELRNQAAELRNQAAELRSRARVIGRVYNQLPPSLDLRYFLGAEDGVIINGTVMLVSAEPFGGQGSIEILVTDNGWHFCDPRLLRGLLGRVSIIKSGDSIMVAPM